MKQKGDVIKRACFISLVLFSILGLTVFVGCGSGGGGGDGGGDGGGGGGGGGTPTSFTTTSLFPLTSNWQTDVWTLFVDTKDHDFFNITTRVMADTRGPQLLYWTNDQDGLRLHGFMDDEGVKVVLSPALLVANPICRIGEKHSGTLFAGPDELNYYIEAVGVEDVTVPAGTFANCMKIRVMIYPVGDLPSDYGYETLWFADNVGFVRAEADDNNFSQLFVDAGDTRELLSYHVTDMAALTEDEQALRDWGNQFKEHFAAEDLDSIMDMYSDDMKIRCMDKATYRTGFENFFNDNSDLMFLTSVEDTQFIGDEAYALRDGLQTRINDNTGAREWIWSRETRHYIKEGLEWKWYGDQLDFRIDSVDVYQRNTASGGVYNPFYAYFLKCGSDDPIDDPPDVIASLTVSGPPGSGIDGLDLKSSWDAFYQEFWDDESLKDAVSGFYTFRVKEPDGNYFIRTDYLQVTPYLALPVHVSPQNGDLDVGPLNGVVLDWDPVDLAEGYWVQIQFKGGGGNRWYWTGPNTQVTVPDPLDPATDYQWRVRANVYDLYGEFDNQSRSDWTWFRTIP
jgi:ketosteroid isomerase-like protein